MAKMPMHGVSVISRPFGHEQLDLVLKHLREEHGIKINLSANQRTDIVSELRYIIGAHLQEKGRLDVDRVTQKLRSVQAARETVVEISSALQTGLREMVDLEAASQIAEGLAGKHGLASTMEEHPQMRSLRESAREVLDAVKERITALETISGQRGRPAHKWYDRFTSLVLEIAAIANIKPTISTNRSTGEKGDDFLELALVMEHLLFNEPTMQEWRMLSPSRKAGAKRLERSQKRLKQQQRQKPSR